MPITEYQREQNRRRHEDARLAHRALMKYYPLSLDNLDGEQWKPITEKYHVSNFGRVKSFWFKTPRILKPKLLGEYLGVCLSVDNEPNYRTIHSLVAQAFIPNPDLKPEVNHDDGHKFNCHVSNLVWSTSAENKRHAVRTGLTPSGLKNPCGKIKDESDILYIRDNPDNLTQQQLADKYGVSESTIRGIQHGKKYQNVGGTIRKARKIKRSPNVPDEIKQQIRAEHIKGDPLYGARPLGRKYGYSKTTILNIVKSTE